MSLLSAPLVSAEPLFTFLSSKIEQTILSTWWREPVKHTVACNCDPTWMRKRNQFSFLALPFPRQFAEMPMCRSILNKLPASWSTGRCKPEPCKKKCLWQESWRHFKATGNIVLTHTSTKTHFSEASVISAQGPPAPRFTRLIVRMKPTGSRVF